MYDMDLYSCYILNWYHKIAFVRLSFPDTWPQNKESLLRRVKLIGQKWGFPWGLLYIHSYITRSKYAENMCVLSWKRMSILHNAFEPCLERSLETLIHALQHLSFLKVKLAKYTMKFFYFLRVCNRLYRYSKSSKCLKWKWR